MISRYALQVAAFGVFAGFAALPTARADEPPSPVNPAISEEAATAVSHMGKTLLSKELSFTAKTYASIRTRPDSRSTFSIA